MDVRNGRVARRGPDPVRQPFELGSMRNPARCGLGTRRREDTLELTTTSREVGKASDRIGSVQKWLERLYLLCEKGEVDPAIDMVLDAVDDLLAARDIERCNDLLVRADVERLSVEASIALLMETLRAKGVLPARRDLYSRVEKQLKRELPDEAEALLEGLG